MRRILATSDYRCLNPTKRAIKLVTDENLSYRESAKISGTSHRVIINALNAIRDGREIGKNGFPSFLMMRRKRS